MSSILSENEISHVTQYDGYENENRDADQCKEDKYAWEEDHTIVAWIEAASIAFIASFESLKHP